MGKLDVVVGGKGVKGEVGSWHLSDLHLGIYRPHAEDVRSETRSALVGGVTTVVSYFRTGSHYMNKTGPYGQILLPSTLTGIRSGLSG